MIKKKSEYTNRTDLLLNLSPKSVFSEAIKNIRTNLTFSEVNKKMKIILITSTEPGDGKSFICANLAIAYAQEGKRVLIIDSDLRKGRQAEIFGVINKISSGYTNLILNYNEKEKNFKLDDYILETSITNVELIANGPIPPNPVELLSSKNNERLLEELKKKYDIIILDCTPIIGISDATIMTKYSDVNLLVVSNKKTKVELIERVKKNFEQANASITGVIVNKADVKGSSYYGYYNDKYYEEK